VIDDKLELHGEMIQIEINCSDTYGAGKLWFKVRGRSSLDKAKSELHKLKNICNSQ